MSGQNPNIKSILCVFLFLISNMFNVTFAYKLAISEKSGTNTQSQDQSDYTHPASYCGISCIYTLIKANNRRIEFRNLIKQEYMSNRKGSSLSELKRAAEDYGMYAAPIGRLTSDDLRQSPYNIILHVKSDIISSYDHYKLFLGTENGRAKLFDPPNPVNFVRFCELAPRWDGNGLIISAKPIDLDTVLAPTRKRFIIYVVFAISFIFVLRQSKRWLPRNLLNTKFRLLGLSVTQAGAFALVALICGMLYNFANDIGLLANAHATASIQQAHAGNFIPKVSERKVQKLIESDAVFIDARFARDYKAGHLKGAISVPVDANDVELQKATINIPKDARIVTYCQSVGCKFAEKVAIKLIDEGFLNISIYKDGWVDWVAKNGKKKDTSS